MTALPDTFMPEGPLRHERSVPAHYVEAADEGALQRAVLRIAATAAFAAAAGLWLTPVDTGDASMQLIKLALSASLVMAGTLVMPSRRARADAEIQIDTVRRCITIIETDARGHVLSRAHHEIDALGEIVLRDGLLTARDASGQPLIALPVANSGVETALRAMLDGTRV